MKKIIVTIIVAACIIFGFTAGGFGKHQPTNSMSKLTIETALASEATPNTVTLDEKSTQDDSIFSRSTILLLGIAVSGIAIFRRNSFA